MLEKQARTQAGEDKGAFCQASREDSAVRRLSTGQTGQGGHIVRRQGPRGSFFRCQFNLVFNMKVSASIMAAKRSGLESAASRHCSLPHGSVTGPLGRDLHKAVT